ncbi:MAG: bifunctional hydroxymethylpyrimidine kinase/phosphomethylpyrimidine kinase [Anaerolineaceae bacterium]|nr:bifunctional hydroxymethylpyrimidine kinase/phosphomethylpyrimidine kinase [Anaerolineaceae bacterium]
MQKELINTIFVGGMNADIIASGVNKFLNPGEQTSSGKTIIGAGGKSRNMAHMMSLYAGPGQVAMLSKTVRDPYHLWEIPVKALQEAGAVTDYIKILSSDETDKLPTIAIIIVNKQGENQIYLLPGISEDFSPQDIEDAQELFDIVQQNKGILALSLEMPLATAIQAVKKANQMGIKVFLDPGGIMPDVDYSELLAQDFFLIKPNEHEVQMLTGIPVTDFDSAAQAAEAFHKLGFENVIITRGVKGAYVFNENTKKHIPIPNLTGFDQFDETGCGDQTMAVLCAEYLQGKSILESTKQAVLAGTVQFFRTGIQPLTRQEVMDAQPK